MKHLIIVFSLFALLYSCSSEKRTHQQETVHNYETGELMHKKIIDLDDSNPSDSIISVTKEFYDKTGKIFFKTFQEKSEDAPYKIESESFSSITRFKDNEERNFIDEVYRDFKSKLPDAFASIKYNPEWVKFESKSFTALFPGLPEENKKDINFNVRYYEVLYKNDDFAYIIRIFHDQTITDENGVNEFLNKLKTPDPSMNVLEEKEMLVLGNLGFFIKIETKSGDNHLYSEAVLFPYNKNVYSIAVVGTKKFLDDSEFKKFVDGFTLTR